MSALPVFDGIHALGLKLALLFNLIPLLDSKAFAAFITGAFLLGARMFEARLSNAWRQRALRAEEELHALRGNKSDPAA